LLFFFFSLSKEGEEENLINWTSAAMSSVDSSKDGTFVVCRFLNEKACEFSGRIAKTNLCLFSISQHWSVIALVV
jgi:hypothetical protein